MTFVATVTASGSRSEDDAMRDIGEEGRQRKRRRPAATLCAEEGGGRYRCRSLWTMSRIVSSSLLDLTSQAPSANVTVFMEGST